MTNRKTTRRALVLSLLSLLLCCSMLVGTTFAWFTDSVQSGNNKIIAGNLDIEMYYSMDLQTWKDDITTAGDIFVAPAGATKGLWEPGHTEVVYLKLVNEGTLSLKYQLRVNPVSEIIGKNEKGEDIQLSKILKFAATEPSATAPTLYTRETAQKAAMEATDSVALTEYTTKVLTMAPGAEQFIALVVYMPEEVGNEANYRGTDIPTITFGLDLQATQVEAEIDSFGKDYDAGAVFADVTVTTADELKAALAEGKKTIAVHGKIELTEGLNASDVTLVGASADAAIDFKTHNLGGSGTITYRNLKLTTQSLPHTPENGERYGWYGGIDYNGHSVANYEGCEISGVFTTYSGTVNIDGCTFLPYIQDGEEFYHIFVYSTKTVNVEDSTFYYGDRAIKIYNEGGVKDVVFNISDSTFKADDSFTAVNKSLINVDATYMSTIQLNISNIVVDEALKTAAVYSGDANKVTATVDGVVVNTKADSQTALNEALNSSTDVAVELAAGTYKMPSTGAAKEITISGTKDTVIDNTMGSYLENAAVSFEGVTIKGSTGMANGNGSDYAALYSKNVTYTNCTFDGPFRVGRDGATFIGCTFTNLGNDYVWTYGNDCTFIGCTFQSEGKALLIYSDGGSEVAKVTVKDCTFNATQGRTAWAIANQNCAAIEIDNYGNGVDLTVSGCTVNSVSDTLFSGLWRIKSYNAANPAVIVNGTTYTSVALDGKLMTVDADRNATFQ